MPFVDVVVAVVVVIAVTVLVVGGRVDVDVAVSFTRLKGAEGVNESERISVTLCSERMRLFCYLQCKSNLNHTGKSIKHDSMKK
jgi:hypothetical protein